MNPVYSNPMYFNANKHALRDSADLFSMTNERGCNPYRDMKLVPF